MTHLEVVAACDLNGATGKSSDAARPPWYIPHDLMHFKTLTTFNGSAGNHKMNAVVMSKKIWESVPNHRLDNRINVVITKKSGISTPPGVHICPSIDAALDYLKAFYSKVVGTVFVIGGRKLFKQALLHPLTRKVHLTIIHETFADCDMRFPLPILSEQWVEQDREYSGVHQCGSLYYSFHCFMKPNAVPSTQYQAKGTAARLI
jgi:dihydrofolate reductase